MKNSVKIVESRPNLRVVLLLLIFLAGGCRKEAQPLIESSSRNDVQATPTTVSPEVKPVADAAVIKAHMTAEQLTINDPIENSIGMVFVPIPAGEFLMGSNNANATTSARPQHLVKITKSFYLSSFVVTQQQYQKVMGDCPWQVNDHVQEGPDYPATDVSWNDAVEFCRKLGEQEGVAYRLPTEAEWEYSCRAGTTSEYSFGDDPALLDEYAWYSNNAWNIGEKYPHTVGQKQPNVWGLYDMHGNVGEWCHDWYDLYDLYKRGALEDPLGPKQSEISPEISKFGLQRILRGGTCLQTAFLARSAARLPHGPEIPHFASGFRPVRVANLPPP
jgi:formylglycine-generating enzyme required for sulfatase activity